MGRSRQRKPTRPALLLTPRQRAAIGALAEGATLAEAARAAQATPDEVLYWMASTEGNTALNTLWAAQRYALHQRLATLASEALAALQSVMAAPDAPPAARVAAAHALIRMALAHDTVPSLPLHAPYIFTHIEEDEEPSERG